MRILSARLTQIRHNRATRRIEAVAVLCLERDGLEEVMKIRTSAPVRAPGAAPLKERLIAAAKLIAATSLPGHRIPEAEVIRPAA